MEDENKTPDITGRKKIEKEFYLQKEYLQLQIDRMPIGCIVWNPDFRVMSWNPAAERIFGFTSQEAMGKHPYDFIVPKEAQLHVDKIWGRLLEGDFTANSVNDNVTKDGRTLLCEWTNTPLRRADGVVIGVLSMVQDITEIRRTEEILHKQRLEQQIILDSVPAIVFYKDKENRFIRINKALADATGLPKEKIEGKSCFEVYPGYAEKYWQDDKEVMAKGEPKRNIIEPMETTKGIVWVQTDKIPYRDEQGNIIGIIGFSVDITERKKAADALQESENKFRSLAEKSLVGIYLIEGGTFKYANARFAEIFGYTVEEVVDKITPKDLAHPEDWPFIEENIKKRLSGEVESMRYSFRCIRKDKKIIYVEVYSTRIEYHNQPAIIGTLLDITESRKAEEELIKYRDHLEELVKEETKKVRENEERFLVAEQAAHMGAFEWNVQTGVNTWTPQLEAMYGLSPGSFAGTQPAWENLVHPDDRAEALVRVQQAFKTNEPVEGEWRVIWPDGSVHWLFGRFQLFRDKSGKPLRLTGINIDITERKKTEAALREAQESLIRSDKLATLGKLAGIVGHELRNPLGAIKNAVYFLRMKLGKTIEDAKVKRHLEILDEEVSKSDKIISDILTFTKIKEPRLSETEINDVIKISLEKIEIPKTIEVVTELKSGLPKILADALQLERVFYNIILNAVEAMPDKGRLTVTSVQKDDFLEVRISDTGQGIPKENLGKIFGPLFSTKPQGIGLGLSLCQEIIQGHKGKIEAESKVGEGTEFTIKLPITKKRR